jgi:hypothetical protein
MCVFAGVLCGRYSVLLLTADSSLSTATISTARNIDHAGIPRFAGLFLRLSRLRSMRAMFCERYLAWTVPLSPFVILAQREKHYPLPYLSGMPMMVQDWGGLLGLGAAN